MILEKSTGSTRAGWFKHGNSPVLGGNYGTCFDMSVLKEGELYRMYFSWRPEKSLALVESKDGIHWSEPVIILGPRETAEGWEDDLNRPVVIKHENRYHMWYTGQYKAGKVDGKSWIFYAVSDDGVEWQRVGMEPVLSAEEKWEKVAVMLPQVIWDNNENLFKMWYAAGEQYEPNEVGYATSPDGIQWTKHKANPVFRANKECKWEQHKTAIGQVLKLDDWYLVFYIGFRDEHYAQIGIARSKDGITKWERHPENPIIAPDEGNWDGEACYKPFTIFDGEKWLLWYNGRQGSLEQIGLAYKVGIELGF